MPEQVSTTATTSEYSIYPNGLMNASISYSNNKFNLRYTKHYYAGSQRISSKLGLGANVGSFNCNWLITPFGSGAPDINEKSTAKAKLDANTAASLAIMQENSITPPVNYGQNAGYAENCVSSYAGTAQEKDVYWYHPDHLGSSSYITGLDGEVTQSIDYFPSGEVFVENHKNSYNTPYKFNGKEQDSETGYYYYGARYYNPRVSLWLNVDPLAEKYPSWSPYNYTFNNPVKYIDPDGRDPITALVEALSSFAISAGTDFLSNWLIGGDNINQAFHHISWGAATADALITYGMSSLINGSGSATVYAKIAKSKAGKIGVNISKTLITNIIYKYEKGEIDELSDIDLTNEFIEATFTALLDDKLGKKADELLELVKESDEKLYTRLAKLKRNVDAEKGSPRIEADKNAVKIAKKNLREYSIKFFKVSATKDIKKKALVDSGKKIISNDNKKNSSK